MEDGGRRRRPHTTSTPSPPPLLAGEEASRAQQEVQIGRSNQTPLVGREHELHILRQLLITTEAFRHLRAAGSKKAAGTATLELQHPQCMALMGEAGIGKTPLGEGTARQGQPAGWGVVLGQRFPPESVIPYPLWTECFP